MLQLWYKNWFNQMESFKNWISIPSFNCLKNKSLFFTFLPPQQQRFPLNLFMAIKVLMRYQNCLPQSHKAIMLHSFWVKKSWELCSVVCIYSLYLCHFSTLPIQYVNAVLSAYFTNCKVDKFCFKTVNAKDRNAYNAHCPFDGVKKTHTKKRDRKESRETEVEKKVAEDFALEKS